MQKTITCIPTGVHQGSQRFPNRNDRPTVKAWRCDLTALSKVFNLYFLACNDTVHVYQPSFPNQGLANEPDLILHPPNSPINGEGIDLDDPHSITRLHVDYLGREEVLLAACDDGDVTGYRVKDIQKAIDHRRSAKENEASYVGEDEVRAFLHRNVGASAWGLAVNRKARMIAISANTHKVTVIAYALSGPGDTSKGSNAFDSASSQPHAHALDFPMPRKRDHVFVLSAETNIPSVSFVNSLDDTTGRWLISSSIDGRTTLWDLHHPHTPATTIQLGWCASTTNQWQAPKSQPGYCNCPDREKVPHGAWGAMLLDTGSAYPLSALGRSIVEPQDLPPCFKDMSAYKSKFSVKKVIYSLATVQQELISNSSDEDDSSDMVIQEEEFVLVDDASGSVNENDDHSPPPESEAMSIGSSSGDDNQGIATEHNGINSNTQVTMADSQDENPGADSLFIPETQSASGQPQINLLLPIQPTDLNSPAFWNPAQVIWDDTESEDGDLGLVSENPPDFPMMDVLTYFNASKYPYCEITQAEFTEGLNIPLSGPLLIMTREEIFLIQKPLAKSLDRTSLGPVFCMRRPLHPDNRMRFNAWDRLCFFHEIPELGIFIVASPCGRAGVFCMHFSPAEDGEGLQYGFKLEYLLPFEAGRDTQVYDVPQPYNEPPARLVGVAVGPVQGMFDEPDDQGDELWAMRPRRWRLLMYYTDHTVLSFELAKGRDGESPGLSELVV